MSNLNIDKEDIFYVSLLNLNEQIALNLVNKDNNMVIYTEDYYKYKIIKNLVIDRLIKEKKVLIISDNIDNNLFQELNLIENKVINISNNDIDSIIKNQLKNISKTTGKTTISKLNVLSRNIIKSLKSLEDINNILNIKGYCGLTLLEMYNLSIKVEKGQLSNEYKRYRIKKPLVSYSYDMLKENVNNILKKDIIKDYIKYKRFNKNKIFDIINKPIDKNKINNSIKKLNGLINNPFSIELPVIKSIYTKYFLEYLTKNTFPTEQDISILSKEVNIKVNSSILNYKNIKSKINPLYWVNIKKYKSDLEESKKNFNIHENIIYLEYIENQKNISIYLHAFNFLKDIITDEEFKKFLKKLLDTNDTIEYLKSLRDTLVIVRNFNIILEKIESLNNVEKEILEYCYNNIENKNQFESLLTNIPNFHLLLNIEEIEVKYKNIIENYNNYNNILNNINLVIDTRAKLIPDVIKYVWDDKFLSEIKDQNININEINRLLNNSTDYSINLKDIILNLFPCIISNLNKAKDIINEFDLVIIYDYKSCYNNILNNLNSNNKYIIVSKEKTELSKFKDYNMKFININKPVCKFKFEKDLIFKSSLQKKIYLALKDLSYLMEINVQLDEYILPIVILDKFSKEPILVIEVDDMIYSKNYNIFKDDIYIHKYLDFLDLKFIRVWSNDWLKDKNTVINNIYSNIT